MAEETSKKKSSTGIIVAVVIVVAVFILIAIVGSSASNSGSYGSSSNSVTQIANTSQNPCSSYSDADALAENATSVSYLQLEKDPSSYMGTPAVFTGQVVQILEQDGQGVIRLAVTKDSFGDWDSSNIIYIQYAGHNDVVDDDVVTVYGLLAGSQTYTSQANFQITVPGMYACFITKKNAAASATNTTQATPPAAPQNTNPPAQTAGSWHTAFTYQNNVGFISTQPFAMQGSTWRVSVTCSPSDASSIARVVTYVNSATGDAMNVGTDSNCTQNPTASYLYNQTPGQYYLEVTSVNSNYTVTVEDYY